MTSTSYYVTLPDGVELPTQSCPSPLNVIVGHGLGSSPSEKHYYNDITHHLWTSTLKHLPPKNDGTTIFFTARGHGDSKGWDKCPPSTFEWPHLAQDMQFVAKTSFGEDSRFVALGQSMGAASALYMAMALPRDRLQALILIRPPRAWEARRKIAHRFVVDDAAQQPPPWNLPLLGAAATDLPSSGYDQMSSACPVLILCHGQDEAHPIETGRTLQQWLPQSRLEIAANEVEARRVWPEIMAKWLMERCIISV